MHYIVACNLFKNVNSFVPVIIRFVHVINNFLIDALNFNMTQLSINHQQLRGPPLAYMSSANNWI